ncbi:MAG: MMPL family transporter [Saccharospirillum sp.]|nr:MMPL family transporter [Saccharospirillum sp.]
MVANWKSTLEGWFEQWAGLMMLRPWWTLAIVLLVLVAMGQSLRFIALDSDLENFIDEDTEVRQTYQAVQALFGRNDLIMLAVQGEVLSEGFLTDLKALQQDLEQSLPHLEELTSLWNASYLEGDDEALHVSDLIEAVPQSDAEWAALRERLERSMLASQVLLSADGRMTLLIIEPHTYDYATPTETTDLFDVVFDNDAFDWGSPETVEAEAPLLSHAQRAQLLAQLDKVLVDYAHLTPMVAGMPALDSALQETMKAEMQTFLRWTVLLIFAVLLLFFRQVLAVVGPLVTVLSALLLTMSALVLTGNKISMPLIMLPSLLLAITIGDSVHLLTHFGLQRRQGLSVVAAMRMAVQRTSIPLLLTSLTTAGGLLSLVFADIVPLRHLGVFSALGVMLAFILTITVLPALAVIMPGKVPDDRQSHPLLSRLMARLAQFSWQHGGKLALLWLVLVALAFTQIVQLRFSHNPMNWMPENLPIVQATNLIDERLSGTMTLDLVFDTGRENGVKDLAFIQALAQWQDSLAQQAVRGVEVAASQSIVDLVRDTHRALQGGTDDQYRLPDTQAFMNEALFLFETSAADQLYSLVDSNYRTTRMTLILPWQDILHYQGFIEQLQADGANRFDGLAELQVSGLIALLAGTLQAVLTTTATSYALAAVVISLMMIALLGSVRLGLLAMLPNLAPILVVMGLMQPFGIALDMITMLVATIAIGITVDNTVHFTHHFQYGLSRGLTVQEALDSAFAGAGQALLTTAMVLTAGFYVFLFSDVSSLFNLGFLSGTAFLLAMASNMTLTPFLLRWYVQRLHPIRTEEANP